MKGLLNGEWIWPTFLPSTLRRQAGQASGLSSLKHRKQDACANLIPKRDFDRAGGLHHLVFGVYATEAMHGVGDGHLERLVILVTDHHSKLFFFDHLHGFHAEAGAEDAIKRGGRAAALQVA